MEAGEVADAESKSTYQPERQPKVRGWSLLVDLMWYGLPYGKACEGVSLVFPGFAQ